MRTASRLRCAILCWMPSQCARRDSRRGRCARKLKKLAFLSIVYVGVEDLKYLKRGGRISGAAATVGSILNIKPLLVIKGEKVEPFADGARQQALQEARGRGDFEGGAGLLGRRQKDDGSPGGQHSRTRPSIEEWKKLGQEAFPTETVFYDPLSYSVSCHTGPNAFGHGGLGALGSPV